MNNRFNELCTPAKLYFVLTIISCAVALFSGASFMHVMMNLIVAFIWTGILSFICGKGFSIVSWFLVLIPYIIMLLVFFKITKTISSDSQIMMVIPPSATQQMV